MDQAVKKKSSRMDLAVSWSKQSSGPSSPMGQASPWSMQRHGSSSLMDEAVLWIKWSLRGKLRLTQASIIILRLQCCTRCTKPSLRQAMPRQTRQTSQHAKCWGELRARQAACELQQNIGPLPFCTIASSSKRSWHLCQECRAPRAAALSSSCSHLTLRPLSSRTHTWRNMRAERTGCGNMPAPAGG